MKRSGLILEGFRQHGLRSASALLQFNQQPKHGHWRGRTFFNGTGSYNIALGSYAGSSLSSGDYNIYIGNSGNDVENGTIRIGDTNQTATFIAGVNGVNMSSGNPVFIDANGQLGI